MKRVFNEKVVITEKYDCTGAMKAERKRMNPNGF